MVTLQLTQLVWGISINVGNSECNFDFLRIYDGPTAASLPLLLSSCAVSVSSPLWFFSSSNQIYIKFTSDNAGEGAGYTIQYTCEQPSGMSGIRYDTGGASGHYGQNETTRSSFFCAANKVPSLRFSQLDIDGAMPSCTTDSLKISDATKLTYGYSITWKTYCGSLTGSDLPQYLGSTSSVMVLFTSDSSGTAAGYTFSYECSIFEYTALTGTLTDSGGADRNYGNNEVWEQIIKCPPSQFVSFLFTSFAIEWSGGCHQDSLSIFDGPSSQSPAIFNRKCTSPPPGTSFVSSSNQVYLMFVSDSAVTLGGYSLTYECQVTPTHTMVADTLYDRGGREGQYSNNDIFNQIIRCPDTSHRVYFRFSVFDMEESEGCTKDVVTVYDGESLPKPQMVRNCTSPGPSRYFTSSTSSVLVAMESDGIGVGEGFALDYSCVTIYSQSSGVIYDSGDSKKYSNWERTFGLIRCPPSTFAHITNLNWNIQQGDLLTIYDGNSAGAVAIFVSEISVQGQAWSAYACSNELYFTFTSDGYLDAAGYDIAFDCSNDSSLVINATLSADLAGAVSDSGGVDDRYRNYENSKTLILCPDGQQVGVYFRSLDIQASEDCEADAVSLYDGATSSSPLIYRQCGSVAEEDLYQGTTSGNKLLVAFRSDASLTKDGFNLLWQCLSSSSSTVVDYYFSVDGSDSSDCGLENYPCSKMERVIISAKLKFQTNLRIHFLSNVTDSEDAACGSDLSFFNRVVFEGNNVTLSCGEIHFIKSYGKVNMIEVQDLTLAGGARAALVDIRDSTATFSRVKVIGGSVAGFKLVSVGRATFEGCEFSHVTVGGGTGPSLSLIEVESPSATATEVTISNCRFTNIIYASGLVRIRSSSLQEVKVTVEVKDSLFEGNTGKGSPLRVDGFGSGSLVVQGSTFTGNTCVSGGGAASVTGSDSSKMALSIKDSHFTGNRVSGDNGGSLLISSVASVSTRNTVFEGNSASSSGGAIALDSVSSSISIDHTKVKGNEAGGNGCGLYVGSSLSLVITNSQMDGNRNSLFSNALGGGISCKGVDFITLDTVNVTSNVNGVGGGMFILDSKALNLQTIRCDSNRAYLTGGCFSIATSQTHNQTLATVSKSTISRNRADMSGGGMSLKVNVTLAIQETTIRDNLAKEWGGGISLHDQAKLNIDEGTNITNNAAVNGGAVNLADPSTSVTVSGASISISGNQARLGGVFYGRGFVSVGKGSSGGVTIEGNTAGPVSELGDSDSSFIGLGAVLFFSGEGPPKLSTAIASDYDNCTIFYFDEKVTFTSNRAKVAGALVFMEKLPFSKTCHGSFMNSTIPVNGNTKWSETNKASYGGMVSSFVSNFTIQVSSLHPPELGKERSYVTPEEVGDGPSEKVKRVYLLPGIEGYFLLKPLDHFSQEVKGTYENLKVTISDLGGGQYLHLNNTRLKAVPMEKGALEVPYNVSKVVKASLKSSLLLVTITKGGGNVVIGNFTLEAVLAPCEDSTSEMNMERESINSSLSLCRRPPLSVGGGRANWFLIFSGAVGAAAVSLTALFIIAHRKLPAIKYRSVASLLLRLVGLLQLFSCMLLMALGQFRMCSVIYGVAASGLFCSLTPLVFQLWRLKKLFLNNGMDKITITDAALSLRMIVALLLQEGLALVMILSAGYKASNPIEEEVEKYSEPLCYADSPAAVYALVVYLVLSFTALLLLIRHDLLLLQKVNVPNKFVGYSGATVTLKMFSSAMVISVVAGIVMLSFQLNSVWDLSEGYKMLLVVSCCLFFLVLTSMTVYRIYTLRPTAVTAVKRRSSSVGNKISPAHHISRPATSVTSTATGTKVSDDPADSVGRRSVDLEKPKGTGSRGCIVSKGKAVKGADAKESEELLKEESQLLREKEDLVEGDDSWCIFLMVEHFKKYEVPLYCIIIIGYYLSRLTGHVLFSLILPTHTRSLP
jgi:predicted outer membrane repeat protein